jgi:coenzyme F420-reducing hydrogenase delta subunit
MEKEWIPVIATLSGGLLVSVFALGMKLIELRYQSKKEKNKLRMEKLEELHKKLINHMRTQNLYAVEMGRLRSKGHTSEELQKVALTLTEPFTEIYTLVSLYVPELKKEFGDLMSAIGELQKNGFDYVDKKITSEEFQVPYKDINDNTNVLLTKLENSISKYI